jgi:8-oxo-dGTP pyrophosphatase MutT (NUDIX family)
MNLSLLNQKDVFPLHVQKKLEGSAIDYLEKHHQIMKANSNGGKHLPAGVIVLLFFKKTEYVFQLIRRSDTVAQGGDISCPGGILEKSIDEMLHHILLKTRLIQTVDNRSLDALPNRDPQTASLIRLFLMNGLREAWEEIGLSPLNVSFLGPLPTYSLTYFERTIFPIVCLVKEDYNVQMSSEVSKVLEIPVRIFFDPSSYAMLEIQPTTDDSHLHYNVKFPCLVIENEDGRDILWGATFNILTNFLKIVTDESIPMIKPNRIVSKVLSPHYASGNHK